MTAEGCDEDADSGRASGDGEGFLGEPGKAEEETDPPAATAAALEERSEHRWLEKADEKSRREAADENVDEEACPFCIFMQAGACGEGFAEWEACIDAAEAEGASMVDRCARVTRLLTRCMRANADYYGPVLDAEKVMDGLTGNVAAAEKEVDGSGARAAEGSTEADRAEGAVDLIPPD